MPVAKRPVRRPPVRRPRCSSPLLLRGLLLVRILFVFVPPHISEAHVIWVDPPPRPSNDIKSFPCGSGSQWGVGPVTTLEVGVNQVVFDEYICHAGDMVRIALSMGSDDNYDQHVLLDRLPHNDMCSQSSNRNMAVNITIPDVDCVTTECSLQIIQVMSSKFRGSSCQNPEGIAGTCGGSGRMYYSCARVQIEGTTNALLLPTTFTDFYGASAPVDYEWPLVADWCRDSPAVPWQICGRDDNTMTTASPDTVFPTVAPTVTLPASAVPTTFVSAVNDLETTTPTSLDETSHASRRRVGAVVRILFILSASISVVL